MYFYCSSIGSEGDPYLPYFLKIQLRKCVEPIGYLANVEELDLKTKQKAGCAEDKIN